MKLKYIYTCVIVWLCTILNAQQIETFNGNEYLKIDNEWKLLSKKDLKHYKVVPNTITVKYKASTTTEQITSLENSFSLIKLRKSLSEYYDYQNPETANMFQIARALKENTYVEYVEIPLYGEYANVPNDTYYNGLHSIYNINQWYLKPQYTDVEHAWDITTGNPNITMAILDQRFDINHYDLGFGNDSYENWLRNPDNTIGWNFETNNTNLAHASGSHGTQVTGFCSAKTNNNFGIAGVAGGWNNQGCRVLPLVVGGILNWSLVDEAIDLAVQRNVRIINMSFEESFFNASVASAIANAINAGVIVVISSGNRGNSTLGFPMNLPNVISVGGTNSNDQRFQRPDLPVPLYSSYGNQLFIAAPGDNMLTNTWTILQTENPNVSNQGLIMYTGTSYSAPIVTGIIGLMLSTNPCLTRQQVMDILASTADKVGGYNYNYDPNRPGHSLELGYGRVNAFRAVQMAQQLATDKDLIIKDSPEDLGLEPNTQTGPILWTSDDIWIRNSNDGGLTHQNPIYAPNVTNYVYVRVKNIGCNDWLPSQGKVTVSWAKASTALGWPTPWDGYTDPTHNVLMGAGIGMVHIPFIAAGDEVILSFPWTNMPNPADYNFLGSNQWHFCLLAEVNGGGNDPYFVEPSATNDLQNYVRSNNNVAWKNLSVVLPLPLLPEVGLQEMGAAVAVGNYGNAPRNVFLELVKEDIETGKPIYTEAEVSVKMDETVYAAWERGGKLEQALADTPDTRKKKVEGNNVLIDNLMFYPHEVGTIYISFNFLTKELTDKTKYRYHVIQKDKLTGEIIGGETFIIQKNSRNKFEADAGDDKEVDLNQSIVIKATDINEPALYNWYDNEGNLVYQGKELNIANAVAEKYKLEVIATADGFKDYAEVEVKLKPSTLEAIAPNPATTHATISYKLNGAESAYLMVIGYYGNNGVSHNYILDVNSSETTINVSNYANGFYTVALVVNGQIVDAKTLIK